ncbi:DUF6090 family protein [Winogradskyella sp. A3E31]|uniref:DUF6090 family protein n=1 Tax=Winogradskyella sp. A3E31 TaxID=3349637 RepID=UPI00398BAD7E
MIKFFRHIRYNLMETGKTSRYLKYAIGEIILVVIGILIALQINNWNENRKTEVTSQKLFNELYNEYIVAGKHFKNSFEANSLYISFLEDILMNWSQLNIETVNEFQQKYFKVNLSTTFYLSSYSQFNDPEIVIFQKAVNDGTINLVNNEFAKSISRRYNGINRLNEMITQEYQIGQEINLHIAKSYSKILVGFKENRTVNIDAKTLDTLFKAFRSDGTLKFLIRSRLDLAKIRGFILKGDYEEIENDLTKFKSLLDD